MSRTLTLIEAGWESARSAAERGNRAGALNQVERVLARTDVPPALASEAHRFAAELALDLERYATARRHLKAAATLEPEHAGTRFLAGRAWEEDPDGCDRRAAIAFRKATKLDPANPLYRASFGRAAARCGKVKRGNAEMLAAVEGYASDLSVVRIVVGGLVEVGKVDDAGRVIARARFLCPGNHELAALWERMKFERARQSQRKTARTKKTEKRHANTRYAQDAQFATDGGRVLLPFLSPVGGQAGTGGTVRRDGGSFPRPHLARLRARKADR